MADEPIKSFLDVDLSKSKVAIAQAKAQRVVEEKKAISLQSRVRIITQRLAVAEARATALRSQVRSQLVGVGRTFAVLGVTELVSNIAGELPSAASAIIGIGTAAAAGFATLGPLGAALGTISGTLSAVLGMAKATDQRVKALEAKQAQIEKQNAQFEKQFEEVARRRQEDKEEFLRILEEKTEETARRLDYESWQMQP